MPKQDPRCVKKNQKRNTSAGGAQSPRGWARPPRSCYVFDFSFVQYLLFVIEKNQKRAAAGRCAFLIFFTHFYTLYKKPFIRYDKKSKTSRGVLAGRSSFLIFFHAFLHVPIIFYRLPKKKTKIPRTLLEVFGT